MDSAQDPESLEGGWGWGKGGWLSDLSLLL